MPPWGGHRARWSWPFCRHRAQASERVVQLAGDQSSEAMPRSWQSPSNCRTRSAARCWCSRLKAFTTLTLSGNGSSLERAASVAAIQAPPLPIRRRGLRYWPHRGRIRPAPGRRSPHRAPGAGHCPGPGDRKHFAGGSHGQHRLGSGLVVQLQQLAMLGHCRKGGGGKNSCNAGLQKPAARQLSHGC